LLKVFLRMMGKLIDSLHFERSPHQKDSVIGEGLKEKAYRFLTRIMIDHMQ